MKFYRLLFLAFTASFATGLTAQVKWDLKSVVEYAMKNNIGVKLSEVQAKIASVNYKQNRLSQIPGANLSTGASLNSGNNQDPVTFSRITQSYLAANMQLQSSADIFNFFSKRYSIQSAMWELEAAKANIDKLKNDIALTAANAFLQILLAKEQQKITAVQLAQTRSQLGYVRRQVEVGTLPELNASQLEAQYALDSVNYISAKGNAEQAILLLKSYMSIDAAAPFEVEAPPVDMIPLEPIVDLQPDAVYQLALINQPVQRENVFRLKAAEKNVASAKGALLPTLSAFGALSSAYNNQALEVTSFTQINPPVGLVNVGGVEYQVFSAQPVFDYTFRKTPFGSQISNNFSQSIGLRIGVPIFNGYSLRSNYKRSQLNVETAKLQKRQDDQKLQQDIYQAYTAAVIALEKMNASKKSVEVTEITYHYAEKRFEVGMLNTYELITSQNDLLRARLEYALNQYDYVFKMKVLEFYKGQGLKL